MAILLSASMVFAPVIQSMPVYAAEPVIEEGSAGTLTDDAKTDEPVADDNNSDTPVSDNGDSENPGTENGDAENPGTENGDPENPGTENGDTENPGTENGDTENPGTETGDTENPGTEDGDTENPEDPDAEAGDSDDLGDAETDESLEEVQDLNFEAVEATVKAAKVRGTEVVNVSDFASVGGWNESIYAEIAGIKDTDVVDVEYIGTTSGTKSGKLSANKVHESPNETDLDYLVREVGGNVRIDIPGLAAGTYTLKVTVGSNKKEIKKEGITVYEHDRSGYAHFNNGGVGVGAYNNDGTLKDNAIVIYVTDENKNDVVLKDPVTGTTVVGIGNILNTVGKSCGEPGHENECKKVDSGKAYYAKGNTNQDILKKLADANRPLVVRFVGTVSDLGKYTSQSSQASVKGLIDGLTIYATAKTVNENGTVVGNNKKLADYGGTQGDNGHMARMKSGKDITLEGIGYDAVIDGWGFHFMCESSNSSLGKSFEARNLTFINTPEDAIGMEGVQDGGKITASVEHCWVHHNEFYCPNISDPAESDKAQGDGSVDFKRGMYFTCSYNYYEGCHKTNLIGSSDDSLQFNLTYHHNYNRGCEARGPLARQANIHMYNNIYDFQSSYAFNPRANAYIFSEYNMFYRTKNPMQIKAGAIKSYNDTFSSCIGSMDGTIVTDKQQKVSNSCKYLTTDLSSFDTDSTLSYIPSNNYKVDTDFTYLRKVIKFETGVQDRYPKRPDDESIQPEEYSVLVKGTTVHPITPPETLTLGKISNDVYAFSVSGGAVDLIVKYAKEPGGVLVNEAGENLLQGSGEYIGLKEGTYIIQPANSDPYPSYSNFKDMTITSLEFKANDPTAHYHKWVEDSTNSKTPTCTEAGYKAYKCTADGCTELTKKEPIEALGHDYSVAISATKEPTCTETGEGTFGCSRCDSTTTGTVPALGHKWGSWEVTTPATESTKGEETRVCQNDSEHKETREIPIGGTGGGNDDPSGGVVFNGDYVLTFEGAQANGNTDFFKLSDGSYENVDSSRIPTVNGKKYQGSFVMGTNTSIEFTCEDDSILFIACSTNQTGKQIKLNGAKSSATDSNATLTIELKAGTHKLTKSSPMNICYLAVASKSSAVYRTLSFVYNYIDTDEDEPDPRTVDVVDGQIYSTMEALVPSSFKRSGYTLKGLYEDAACTRPITYPYTVSKDVDFYAKWEEDDTPTEKSHILFLDANNNTAKTAVTISESQIYEIKEKPTRAGYVFAGWYDAKEGGSLVSSVDGRTMTADMTVYAHWNALEAEGSLFLDCAKDLTAGDITSETEKNGFIIHASSGGVGDEGKENPKYYMSVKTNKANGSKNLLFTNGMLLDDKTISGNENGLLKTIEFTAPGAGVLTVSVAGSGNFTPDGKPARNCHIAIGKLDNGTLTEISSHQVTSETVSPVEFKIDAAGTYYIYAKQVDANSMGVVYSSIKFAQPQYTILYEPGIAAASGDFASVTAKAGDEITLPAYTAKPGYTFKGWALEDTETVKTSYTVDPEDAVDGIITFVALYEAGTYEIEFKANGGTMDSADVTDVEAGTVITLPTPEPPENKLFVAWTIGTGESKITLTGKTYTVRAEDAVGGKITITAEYKDIPEPYTIKLDAGLGTLGVSDTILEDEGNTIQLGGYTPTPPADQRFMGWQIGNGEPFKDSYTVNASDAVEKVITLKAVYVTEYTVNFVAGEGTLPTGMVDGNKYIEGETVTLGKCTLAETSNNEFDGWYINNPETVIKTSSYTVDPADADPTTKTITLTAKYIPKGAQKYTVTLDLDGGKLVGGNDTTSLEYTDGSEFNETAEKDGYNFIGWTLNGQKITIPYPVTGNVTLKAEYEVKPVVYTINFDAGEGTLPSEMVNDKEYKEGETVTLYDCTLAETSNNKFDGWYIKGSETPLNSSYTVNPADADSDTKIITITAKYVPKEEVGPSHERISIIGLETSYEYTGAKIIPNIGVVDYNIGDGKLLAPGVDYTVKYKDNKKPGEATITVTGKGNYAGKDITKKFKIVEVKDVTTDLADLKGAKIAKINSEEYTGEKHYPDFTLTLKGKEAVTYTYNNGSYEIKTGTDAGTPIAANVAVSNNVNKGTATILITGKTPDGKTKATSVKKTFKITAIDLAKNASKVNVTTTAGTYSVKGAAPGSITVTYDGKELRKGTDYTVKYTGNKKVTTSAQIVITGKGNYAKKVTGKTYSINKLDMSELEVKAVTAYEGIRAGKVKATVLDGDGNILKPSQYTLKVYTSLEGESVYDASKPLEKNTTIYVAAEAKDTANLDSATERAEFTVAEKTKNIAKAKIKLNKDATTNKTITKTYDGKEQTLNAADLTVTIKGQEKALVMGEDFVIAGYSNNINKGTATAIIKGIDKYSGTKTVKFKIVGKTMVIDGDEGITWDDVTGVISSFMKKFVK
ncbi:MAG: hypothetical protein HDR29_00455 [Lachnospiraceae bacterium]|nr:hypothetical protein [Lachnospiraceae bacterium]